jgi:hypothetical protein
MSYSTEKYDFSRMKLATAAKDVIKPTKYSTACRKGAGLSDDSCSSLVLHKRAAALGLKMIRTGSDSFWWN